jgi:hypothetical protein
LAIAAVAVTHEQGVGGTFVAHRAAKTTSGKCSSHRFPPGNSSADLSNSIAVAAQRMGKRKNSKT